MTASPGVAAPPRRLGDPVWTATAIAGSAQLGGLAVALADLPAVLALSISIAGVVVGAFVLAPAAAVAVRRRPGLLLVAALALLGLIWVVLGVWTIGVGANNPLPGVPALDDALWSLRHGTLLPLALMSAAALGGLVLIADALRVRRGLVPHARAPWRQMTTAPDSRRTFPWRGVVGVLLVGWAAFLAIGIAGPQVAGDGLGQLVVLLVVGGAATVVIATPLLVASFTRVDRAQAYDARESERQRFAAHLHDSVLQTLALVQRQAHDPAAVTRLARRQEHSLRAWMAGETELVGETLVAALRDAAAEVEDEQHMTVELTAIGDRPIDAPGEALVAAAREALRNAARHAGGAPVLVFAQITGRGVEVFIRDDGAGFDPASVGAERRGIRDAIVGRMAVAGGQATIESAPGEGTEVALRLGASRGSRSGQ